MAEHLGRGWIDWLPDEIAKAALEGQPVVYPSDGPVPLHVLKLMNVLGVSVIIRGEDPRA